MAKWITAVLVVGLSVLWGTATVAAQGGDTQVETLTQGDLERQYTVYVPASYDGESAVPLVVALHSFASSGQAMAALTGFNAMAEERGFLVVYPEAADLMWAHGVSNIGWLSRLALGDDVAFITALLDTLAEQYNIDPARVYLTGQAGGGEMALRLACTVPERFARVATVGTAVWNYHTEVCPAEQAAPVQLLMLLGEEDVDNPPRGLSDEEKTVDGETVTVQAFNAYQSGLVWAGRNGCDTADADRMNIYGDQLYDDCEGEGSVALHVLAGVGNTWPRLGDYVLNDFGIDATQIVTGFFFDEFDASVLENAHPAPASEQFGGAPRGFVLYVPPTYDPDQPTPMVVALHGRPGTAAGMAYMMDLNRVAAEEDFIALYPEGTLVAAGQRGREWNYTRGAPGYEIYDVDDVEFLSVLIDDLAQNLNIDRQRIYATGFSNGGFMTQRLACSAGDTFAAFAEIGSALFPNFIQDCSGQPPVPMLLMHGTADLSVPWEGSSYDGTVIHYSVPDTAIFWATHNECDPQSADYEIIPPGDEITTVYHYWFDDCAPGAPLHYYVIEGGGHNLPGVPQRLSDEIARQVNTDIHAGEVVWDFFQQFELE